MEYRISKEQCQDSISGICSQCGGPLEPIETVDNGRNPTFWAGCVKCGRFDNGVNPKIYATAKVMVVECNFRPYSHIHHSGRDSSEEREYKINSQIAGACDVVRDVLRIHEEG